MPNRLVRSTARWLARMMKGESLTLSALEHERGAPNRPALRKRMHALVDALPHAHRSEPGRGKPEKFWWVWPSKERSRPEQVWALATARALLAAFNDTQLGGVLDDLLGDHSARLADAPPPQSDLSRMFYASARMLDPLGIDADVIDAVAHCTYSQRALRFDYTQFSGDRFPVVVEPWTLLMADEGLYLYGRCIECDAKDHHIDTRRIYRVSRMTSARTTKDAFVYPVRADHDPAVVFAHSWGLMVADEEVGPAPNVQLRFAPGWATYLRDQKLHPTQGEVQADESGFLTIAVAVHITYDLVRWVRGHGNDLEVVAPENLAGWVMSGDGGSPASYGKWVLEPARARAKRVGSQSDGPVKGPWVQCDSDRPT